MRMGLVANLDGTAIAYTAEGGRLVVNGRFRTDLPLEQLARLLGVSVVSLANRQSPFEIDPDAELFSAQSGTLTENGKLVSRKLRERQVLEGKKAFAVYSEWVVTNFSFTLKRLKHPTDAEGIVLAAIVDAASGTMPKPGDKVRAVAVSRGEIGPDRIALAAGMLPLEVPMR
jgi:hypothetical protein